MVILAGLSWMPPLGKLTHLKTKPPESSFGIGRKTEIRRFPLKRSFPNAGGADVSTRTLSPVISWDVAPAPVGWFSCREQGSELRRLVYPQGPSDAIPQPARVGLKEVLRIVVEFCARHADLRLRGRGDRLASRTIAGAPRTYGLVRGPRSRAGAALPGEKKHDPCHGGECAKSPGHREGRQGLSAHR